MKTKHFILITLIFSLFLVSFKPLDIKYFTRINSISTNLKAVLVVGPQQDGTEKSMTEMDKIADYLVSEGINVQKFYDDKAKWKDIIVASNDANIFIYSGHGSTKGENGVVGGLCLASDLIVSSAQIIDKLKFHSNAIVIIFQHRLHLHIQAKH